MTRKTSSGRRFGVRYRLGGRALPIVHGGSFEDIERARARRDPIAGELAAGRNAAEVLGAMTERSAVRAFAEWAEADGTSRVDYASETTKNTASHLKLILPTFGDMNSACSCPSLGLPEGVGCTYSIFLQMGRILYATEFVHPTRCVDAESRGRRLRRQRKQYGFTPDLMTSWVPLPRPP